MRYTFSVFSVIIYIYPVNNETGQTESEQITKTFSTREGAYKWASEELKRLKSKGRIHSIEEIFVNTI